MITRPLDLQARVAAQPRDLDVFFWVCAALVVLLFSLHGSRFIVAPGVAIQIGQDPTLVLPQSGTAQLGGGSVVVSYRRDNMILFEGGVYELKTFLPVAQAYAKQHPGTTMLVQSDKQVTIQGLLDLGDVALKAGFVHMVLATEDASPESGGLVDPGAR